MHTADAYVRYLTRLATTLCLAVLAACGGGESGHAQGTAAIGVAPAAAPSAAPASERATPLSPLQSTTATTTEAALNPLHKPGDDASLTPGAVATPTVERDSPWGVAPSAALSYNPEAWVPDMAAAGVTSVRGFHRTTTLDRLPPITDAGMSGVGFLMWSPGATLTLPIQDLPGWRAYVTDQVTRYKGRVKHWEVWNEAPNFTADTSPESYGRVVAAAYEAAKAVDPSVQIGLAAKSNHVAFLAESIAAGAADKFDFITLHPYEVAGSLAEGWEGMYMSIVPRLRKMLADKNPARVDVPVWFTEIGMPASAPEAGGVGPDGQADGLVKIYTMAIAQGVARTYWFDPRDSEGLTMGLTAADGSRRPAWHALRALSTTLGARPEYRGWTQPGLAYHGFVFSSAQGVVLSAWAPRGETRMLDLASEVTAVNPRTGATQQTRRWALGSAPTLLVAPTGSAQAQQWLAEAAASVGKPFPWGGDFSRASSVSLTAGSPPRGLHLMNPPPVTTFGGMPEFSFQGREGPAFAVDPEFLSYTTTAVKLTVTLRRLNTASAGFNVKYEADVPLSQSDGNALVNSSAGWHPVAGTGLYERSWILPNTRFIGKYGYNFRLDSDGPAHANFSIHQVSLSRL